METDVRTALKTAVMRLDPDDRVAVLLHYADGLTIPEIAAVLEVPVADVSGRLERLRWRLGHVMHDALAATRPKDVKPVERRGIAVSG
ncbi:MAG: sigma factor-like helix-turn-helix DNA-binding protein [Planctomycetota bacterium]